MDFVVKGTDKTNFKCYCFLTRKNNQRKTKKVFEAQPEGKIIWGRLRKEQNQYIEEIARERGIELNTLEKFTHDRK